MKNKIVLTIIADDQPGIIEKLSNIVKSHNGNWLESSMSQLAGKFAGILLIEIDVNEQTNLQNKLDQLSSDNIQVIYTSDNSESQQQTPTIQVNITANDRPGIVQEIAGILASNHINVEKLSTQRGDAPMSSGGLFKASFRASLPDNINQDDLQMLLENTSNDLIVEIYQ